jgi:hypothetical protein
MNKKFKNSQYRHAYVASNTRRGIAYQLRAMRGDRTQGEIGRLVGKPQNVVSRLEDPRYGKATVQTLLDFAAAFDVALLVKFVSFGRLEAETENLSQDSLIALSYSVEEKMQENPATTISSEAGEYVTIGGVNPKIKDGPGASYGIQQMPGPSAFLDIPQTPIPQISH